MDEIKIRVSSTEGPVNFSGLLTLLWKASTLAMIGTMIGALISVAGVQWNIPWLRWVSYCVTFPVIGLAVYLIVKAIRRFRMKKTK